MIKLGSQKFRPASNYEDIKLSFVFFEFKGPKLTSQWMHFFKFHERDVLQIGNEHSLLEQSVIHRILLHIHSNKHIMSPYVDSVYQGV